MKFMSRFMRATFFLRALLAIGMSLVMLSQPAARNQVKETFSSLGDRVSGLVSSPQATAAPVETAGLGLQPGVLAKIDLLETLTVAAPDYGVGYDRDEWGPWSDTDGDCLNTRHELLTASSAVPVTTSNDGCWVVQGLWWDAYGNSWFTDPSDIDIDHVVPVAGAAWAGGNDWSRAKKQEFYNEVHLGNLIPVHDVLNREKSALDAAEWLPPNADLHCAFATQVINVKAAWGLSVSAEEHNALSSVLVTCTDVDLDAVRPTPAP